MTSEILLGHFLCLFSDLLELSRGGFLQACVLLKIGGVYCWGNNDNGELGTGDKTARLIPTSVMGLGAGLKNDILHSSASAEIGSCKRDGEAASMKSK
jgi:hypothetical protein